MYETARRPSVSSSTNGKLLLKSVLISACFHPSLGPMTLSGPKEESLGHFKFVYDYADNLVLVVC